MVECLWIGLELTQVLSLSLGDVKGSVDVAAVFVLGLSALFV